MRRIDWDNRTEDISGILYTREITNNLPYYMIVYTEDGSMDFEAVRRNGRVAYIAHNTGREFICDEVEKLLKKVSEIEKEQNANDEKALEITFSITVDKEIIIHNIDECKALSGKARLMTDKEFMDTKSLAKCTYLDNSYILSDSAVWKLGIVLGNDPRPLDFSLFDELFAPEIWSKGIGRIGYMADSTPMQQKVGNKPYVSVKSIFESMLPANLPEQFKYRITEYYEKKLKDNRKLHSTVDDDILMSVYTFTTASDMEKLKSENFSDDEIEIWKKALYKITHRAIVGYDDVVTADNLVLDRMKEVRDKVLAEKPMEETNVMKIYKYISELLTEIKNTVVLCYLKHGIYAGIGEQIIKSAVSIGILDDAQTTKYLNNLNATIAEFAATVLKLDKGELSREKFDSVYGQISPRYYDIRTACFKDMSVADIISVCGKELLEYAKELDASKDNTTIDKGVLQGALEKAGFTITAEKLLDYTAKSIKFREKVKFEYAESLGLMLDIIKRFGDLHGIAMEDMSYLDIHELLAYHSRDAYIQIIEERRNMYHSYSYLILPGLIFDVGDIDVIEN